eukprot:472622_1
MSNQQTVASNWDEDWFDIPYTNTDPANINQTCFCRNPLVKYPNDWTSCYCCCKKYEPNEVEFYYCRSQCLYHKTTGGIAYAACAKCYEAEPDTSCDDNDNEHSFMIKKIEETLSLINKGINQCKYNEETRKYMVNVYRHTYTLWIKRLNEKDFSEIFMSFYLRHLKVVKNEIDLAELQLKKEIIWNKVGNVA